MAGGLFACDVAYWQKADINDLRKNVRYRV
jgi:hypothetical protein